MHDWTLERLTVDWNSGEAHAFVRSPKGSEQIRASGLREIRVPKHEEWGPSVSINSVDGPNRSDDGLFHLNIEMQSGDLIEIVAESIAMPNGVIDVPSGLRSGTSPAAHTSNNASPPNRLPDCIPQDTMRR